EDERAVAVHGPREPACVADRVELELVVEADGAGDLVRQIGVGRLDVEARFVRRLELVLDGGQLATLGRVGEGRAALEVAVDRLLRGELRDLLDRGEARLRVNGGRLLPGATEDGRQDGRLQRAHLRRRAA